MAHTLLLASKSPQRRQLLETARIPFVVIQQDADETMCDWSLPLPQLLKEIALYKMQHVVLPVGKDGEQIFVLTVDTMIQDGSGRVYGKPADRSVAVKTIQSLRDNPGEVGTAFCLEKKQYTNGSWHTIQQIVRYVSAQYVLDISDAWINHYLDAFPEYLNIAGALSIEGVGAQFLKSLNGSYTTAIGLPLYELREALAANGFFK